MSTVWQYWPLFLEGAWTTLVITVLASSLMIVIAVIVGVLRVSPSRPVRWLAVTYVEIFRGTSLYVQLFWFYFALPLFGITIEAMPIAVVGLALCLGAYGAEVVRAAILAVPREQIEAGIALGYDRMQRMRLVILPQALRAALPPLNNLCIELLKGTALVALITVPDLTYYARMVTLRTLDSATAFTVVLIVYFLIARTITLGFRRLERRYSFGRRLVG